MGVTLTQVANFIRAVELQSLSKAAGVVRIAQPALSRQIRALEAELGTPLLIRHGWGVTATPAGAVLLEHGRRLLRDADSARAAVTAMAEDPSGLVSLIVPNSLAPTVLPLLMTALNERYPAIRQHFVDNFAANTPALLLEGDLDLAIMSQNLAHEPLIHSPLFSENLLLAGPPGHVFPSRLKTSELLRSNPLILPSRPNPLRLLVDRATQGRTRLQLEVDSHPAIIEMLRQGMGFAVLPYHSIFKDVESGSITICELTSPAISRTLSLVRPPKHELTPAVAAVEAEIRRIVRETAPQCQWRPIDE